MALLLMTDVALQGKRVLIREDLNVPINEQGEIADDTRIRSSLDTLRYAIEAGARVMVMSHLGRPVEGHWDAKFSLSGVAERLGTLLSREIPLIRDWTTAQGAAQLQALHDAEMVLLENVRFNVGEKENSEPLSRQMATLCDIYVMDAFASAHRAQASTYGIAQYAPIVCAGPLLVREVNALNRALQNPAHPIVALIGGAKIATKLGAIKGLIAKADQVLLGGGIVNTIVQAEGLPIGQSLYDATLVQEARNLMRLAKSAGKPIPLPEDFTVAEQISAEAQTKVCSRDQVGSGDHIVDLGPQTIAQYEQILMRAQTIIWNGPVGIAEYPAFSKGTRCVANAIAQSDAYSLIGGGDTIAAIHQMGLESKMSYISTGGGALLEFLEGKSLPAIQIIEERNAGLLGGAS